MVRSCRAGQPFILPAPRVVGVELWGKLNPWVQAKDVVLELLRRRGVRGGVGCVFEFFGEGVATLNVTQRGTICNMVMETGATTGLFPSDEQTHEWLAIQQRETEWQPLAVAIKVHQVPRSRYWRGGVYSGRLTRAEQEANLVATAGRARKNGRVLVGTHQGIFCRLPQASREDQGGL